ncbi:DUF4830 domain-containing protein [Bacillus shivajii]|uniref:DUF4830 domain-containing protein n=1 Tax=Bacillus shivajii TaxID=1983719 RepID=UPI001CF9F31B|nr:DUF4830 domain-containing protein [Bacillus shivajii]UCZ51473.1 DUF4830 domain-containing protein [Bacillus shivajii]
MREISFLIFVLFIFIIGCQDREREGIPFPKEHENHLSSYGWDIRYSHSEVYFNYQEADESIVHNQLYEHQEYVQEKKENANIDLTPYLDEPILQRGYIVEIGSLNYDWIQAYVYEADDEIIGGYLVLYRKDKNNGVPVEIPLLDYQDLVN